MGSKTSFIQVPATLSVCLKEKFLSKRHFYQYFPATRMQTSGEKFKTLFTFGRRRITALK
jgi:hypothetical protein